jgi:4-amino-4-deoxy-L-arabinose transferase-like glycosyltransferase
MSITAEIPVVGSEERVPASQPRPGGWAYAIRSSWDPRRRRAWMPAVLVGLTVAGILVVHAVNMWQFPTANDDEGTYLAQAYAVRNGWGLAHYTYWYDHPPLAWMQLALLSWVPEVLFPEMLAVGAGRLSMLPVTAASLVLVYVLLRRLGFARWVGALAIVIYGLSPLSVSLMRQIYLDGFAIVWMLAAMVLIQSHRSRLWHHVAAGVAFGVAVLSKETILVVLPALLVMLWTSTEGSGRRFSLVGFIVSFLAVGAYYPLYAALKGELLPGDRHVSLVGAWLFQLRDRQGSGSILDGGSDAHHLVMSWLGSDPFIIVAGLVAVVAAIRAKALRGPAIALVMLVAVGLRPGGYLPTMYILALLPLFALLIAGGTSVVAAWAARPDGPVQAVIDGLVRVGRGAGLGERALRVASWVRPTVAVALVGAAVAVVAPTWYEGNRYALTASHHDTYAAAANWMHTQVADPREVRAVVDSTLWLDLVRHGYKRENVIWFYKLDVDPAVMATLPGGWRDIDYLVATAVIRGDDGTRTTLDELLAHSDVVASFGEGDGRIDIHKINPVPDEPSVPAR